MKQQVSESTVEGLGVRTIMVMLVFEPCLHTVYGSTKEGIAWLVALVASLLLQRFHMKLLLCQSPYLIGNLSINKEVHVTLLFLQPFQPLCLVREE